jgi:tryptophanyl-tRNA synthetase
MNLISSLGVNSNGNGVVDQQQPEDNDELVEDASAGLCLGLLAYPVLQAADILVYK